MPRRWQINKLHASQEATILQGEQATLIMNIINYIKKSYEKLKIISNQSLKT